MKFTVSHRLTVIPIEPMPFSFTPNCLVKIGFVACYKESLIIRHPLARSLIV